MRVDFEDVLSSCQNEYSLNNEDALYQNKVKSTLTQKKTSHKLQQMCLIY